MSTTPRSEAAAVPATVDLLTVRAGHESELRAFLYARLSHAEAEDVLQEIWIRLLEGKFPGGHLRGWLFTVARNLVLDRHRQPVAAPLLQHEEHYSRDGDPVESLLVEEHRDRLRECLDKLPRAFRDVVEGRLRNEKTEALAERLGISAATVPTRYHRAVQHLQTCMGETVS